jgi:hypothetical protein
MIPLILGLLTGGCGVMFDETIYQSCRYVEKRWQVGDRPRVFIQLNGTHVTVTRGVNGEVNARLRLGAISDVSQKIADSKVRVAPGARFEQEGDYVQIIDLPGNMVARSLDLVVPPNIDLEIQAPHAEIRVGCDEMGSPGVPIPVVRLKAATERRLTACVERSSFGPSALDLGAGYLRLTIDGSSVKPTEHPSYPKERYLENVGQYDSSQTKGSF